MAYANVTLATLKTRLDDRLEISSFYTAAEKLLALNEAIRLWNLFTGTWRQRITHALQRVYADVNADVDADTERAGFAELNSLLGLDEINLLAGDL